MLRGRAPLTVAVAAAALGTAGLIATDARADEPVAPEVEMNPTRFPPPPTQPALVLIGGAVTAGWYVPALLTSLAWPDSNSAGSLKIPVAGPYMALFKTDGCNAHETHCSTFSVIFRSVVAGLSAVGQTGGVLVMLEGLFVPTAVPSSSARRTSVERSSVSVAPVAVGSTGTGLGLVGAF
jgi:hypothetical protein